VHRTNDDRARLPAIGPRYLASPQAASVALPKGAERIASPSSRRRAPSGRRTPSILWIYIHLQISWFMRFVHARLGLTSCRVVLQVARMHLISITIGTADSFINPWFHGLLL